MNYPVWELGWFGGSSLIALIAVVHAFVAQFAVGGGIFLWWLDRRAQTAGDAELLRYVRRHTSFFLLLTMVFGAVTGVGIWFVIGLVNPAGTSVLIHGFVFGWAIEWVFFLVEIVALLVYHYQFHRLPGPTRARVAAIYAVAAWLSLVVINGILSFMLTPGAWLQTGDFWDGFFNPTFAPSLVYRTFVCLTLAGLFAFVTSVEERRVRQRQRLLGIATRWAVVPMLGLAGSTWWYYRALPEAIRADLLTRNPQATGYVHLIPAAAVGLVLLALLAARRLPRAVQGVLAALLVLLGLGLTAPMEYLREIARKPYVIHGHIYSTGIRPPELPQIERRGMLASARWVSARRVTADNELEVGRELFNIQCLPCHTAGGSYNDIGPHTESLTRLGIEGVIAGLGKVHRYMPPFPGHPAERRALARHIAQRVHGRPPEGREPSRAPARRDAAPPPRAPADRGYTLLAWNDLGMHCISDSSPWFVILPPANTLEAMLIRRGPSPQIVTSGVELTYAVEPGHAHPSRHVPFWRHSAHHFGKRLPDDVGLAGKGMTGALEPNEALRGSYIAHHIPVVPYRDDGGYNPYPLFTIEARDAGTNELLASTRVVAPTTTEMGCRSCHGGGWRKGGSGIADETAQNILALHDRDNGTSLLAEARAGRPRLCQSCHADPALGARGKPERLNLSASIHGWHASYMPLMGQRACHSCHPASPRGNTRCLRGVHAGRKVRCTSCHGSLDEHAAALLKAEARQGKPGAPRLLAALKTVRVASIADVKPRRPWLQQPDCLTCHVDYERPDRGATAFNRWNRAPAELFRMRGGMSGVRCQACHGTTHALYPATNPHEAHRDNLQPLSYGGLPRPVGAAGTCDVCHTDEVDHPLHHPNMKR